MKNNQKLKTLFLNLSKWVCCGLIVGMVVGTFTTILLNVNDFLGNEIRSNHPWIIYFLPLGGILIGFIYMHLGTRGGSDSAKGNNLVIEGVQGRAKMLKRLGPLVYLGTFLTILLGGSTGREGAAIQMGGSVAESVNQRLRMNPTDSKILLMSGISAGFGAAFGTPVAGAVFGMELTALGKLRYEALIPCFVSSFAGHYMATSVLGIEHENFIIFNVPDFTLVHFIIIIMLSVIFGLAALLYCQLRHGIQRVSEKLFKKNHMIRAFVGGLIIVALMLIVGNDEYNGRSLDLLEQSFKEGVPGYAFLAKLAFTAVTMGSGFVGGEAIPLFTVGATLGNTLSGFMGLSMSFVAAIGFVAVFCGGANTPISAFILGVELFHGEAVEYIFIACVVSYIISGTHGLWPSQKIFPPKSRLYSLADGNTIESFETKNKGLK